MGDVVTLDTNEDDVVSLIELRATDELVGALLAGEDLGSDPVAHLLDGWRASVEAEPFPELVDLDTAVAIITAAARRPGGPLRRLLAVAGAAVVLVAVLAGTAVTAASARPTDAVLWPIARVFFAEHVESVEAAGRAEVRITRAKSALLEGRSDRAAAELNAAAVDLIRVQPEEGYAELSALNLFLALKAQETPIGVPVDPGTPLLSDPARPVPFGAAIGAPVVLRSQATALPVPVAPAPPAAPSEVPTAVVVPGTVAPSPAPAPVTAPPVVTETITIVAPAPTSSSGDGGSEPTTGEPEARPDPPAPETSTPAGSTSTSAPSTTTAPATSAPAEGGQDVETTPTGTPATTEAPEPEETTTAETTPTTEPDASTTTETTTVTEAAGPGPDEPGRPDDVDDLVESVFFGDESEPDVG